MKTGAVVVVDDDAPLRELVGTVLRRAGFETVEAQSGTEALALFETLQPALVVLDVALPGGLSGYELCRVVRERFGHDVPVIFLSGERTESFDRVAGLLIGADDYLTKPFAPDELVARARALIRRTPSPSSRHGLTRREHEILTLLAEGRTQKQIAGDLVISPKTVGAHIERILAKLDVHSRAAAVAMAYRLDLIGVPV